MTPTQGGAAATSTDPRRTHILVGTMGALADHQGDYQVRRLSDEELLERTPDLERAIAVADAEPFGAYVDYVRVCVGDPLGLGLSIRQKRDVQAGAALFADRTTKDEFGGALETQAECDKVLLEMGVEKIGLPRPLVQESIYREACRMGRES